MVGCRSSQQLIDMKKTFLSVSVILFALSGCYYDKESELYPGSCATPNPVKFSEHVLPLLTAKCAVSGCHVAGGSGPGEMDQYGIVKASVDNGKFANRVLTQKDMPPGGLPACDLALLDEWILGGALND